MNSARCAKLLLAAIPLLAGCGNFWQAPSTTSTSTSTTTDSSGYFYVLNSATLEVAGYSIQSGALTAVSGSPYAMAAAPMAAAIAPGGGFLYVSTVSGIYTYSIGSDGALSIANNGQPAGVVASSLAVDPSGAWLIAAVYGEPQLDALPIASGIPQVGATPASQGYNIAGASIEQIAISGDDAHVFAAMGPGGSIVVPFNAGVSSTSNPLSSSYTLIPLVNSGGGAFSVAVDPSTTPRLFYIGESLASGGTTGGLRVFNYSSLGSATLTQAAGSPIASGGGKPTAILPFSGGDYVFVANASGLTAGAIQSFSITASGTTTSPTYTIASGSSIPCGDLPSGLAEDSLNSFVLVTDSGGNPDLEAYTSSSGTLTSVLTAATGNDPVTAVGIVAAP
jgi:6-phosphogluconolactonase